MIDAIISRLGERVDALKGRIRGGADFARLMASKSFQDASGATYVLPLALRGGQADAATGAFRQQLDRIVGVVLIVPSTDPLGTGARDALEARIEAVTAALAGWRPPGAIGPLRIVQGRMINVGAGLLVYQLDFAVQSQLRINPS